jgi:C4-dicarboxylate transporter DctM subunit
MEFLVLFVLPTVLLLLGVPIFVSLIASAAAGMWVLGLGSLSSLHSALFGSIDSFPLLAVPLFILAGEIMARGGIAQRLIELTMSMFGGIRGSLPLATIGSASVFGAMSGSSVACVAAIGKLTLPTFEKGPYGRKFGVSLVTVTGVIDAIIPPSIPMILYGITAQVSIPHLFLAGIVPGLLVAGMLAVYVVGRAYWLRIPPEPSTSRSEVAERFVRAIWALAAPVVILGGVYGGVFTPTEAAGVACIYSLVVSVFIHREMNGRQLVDTILDSAKLVAQIMVIVAAAGTYSYVITTSGLPGKLVSFITELKLEVWMLMLIINIVLLFVGSVLEPPGAILILTPLLVPVVQAAGIDLIHFGLIVTVNLAIGMFLPPLGLNLLASHALFGVPLSVLYRGVVPFLIINLFALVLITYIPAITLEPLRIMLGR